MRLLFIMLITLTVTGCANYTPLKEGHYNKVQPELLVEAGNSGNPILADSVHTMLHKRLTNPELVTDEQTIEGCIAISKIGDQTATPVLAKLITSDASSDVRYFAASALHKLSTEAFKAQYQELRKAQKDTFVIQHLESLR